jgi:hypothetical protein
MKALLPLVLSLSACSASHAYRQPAEVAISGTPADTWDAQAAEGLHVHPREGSACPDLPRILEATARATGEPRMAEAGATLAALTDGMLSLTHGASFGGPGRLSVALRHYSQGDEMADRGLFIVTPALRAGEMEREFREDELRAELQDPILSVMASLKTGRVLVRRKGSNRCEFQISLILSPEAGGDLLRIEARAEAVVAR